MSNTVKRVISGICFGAVMLAAFLCGKVAYLVVFEALLTLMMYEFYNMTAGPKAYLHKILGIATGLFIFSLSYALAEGELRTGSIVHSVVPVLVLLTCFIFDSTHDSSLYGYIFTGLLYIAVPFSTANFLVFTSGVFDAVPLLLFFLVIWAGDVGAYAFGCTLGRRFSKKLCPSISPKKTWTGFWGGLFLALVTGIVAAVILGNMGLLGITPLQATGLSLTINVAGVLGDLAESRWKRIFGLKDSGNLIPGHGGFLDRLDSSLFAIPAGLLYLMIII